MLLWLVINNRALTRDNLAKRKKVEDESCLFCSEKESIHHIFFECVVARQLWVIISEILGCNIGSDIVDVGKYWLSNKKFFLLNMITSAVFWSI